MKVFLSVVAVGILQFGNLYAYGFNSLYHSDEGVGTCDLPISGARYTAVQDSQCGDEGSCAFVYNGLIPGSGQGDPSECTIPAGVSCNNVPTGCGTIKSGGAVSFQDADAYDLGLH